MKKFAVLVPMKGDSVGKIAQHVTEQPSMAMAVEWAEERFIHSLIIIELIKNEETLPGYARGNRQIVTITK